MGKTRFDKLHTAGRVACAEQIAVLALAAEEKGGKPILYMTKWDIAKALDSGNPNEPLVSASLRLASTAEFTERYGYSFILPGNGRSGATYGYVLQHDRSKLATDESSDALNDTDFKLGDHLRGSAAHWHMIHLAHGGNTTVGKVSKKVTTILLGAADAVEATLNPLNGSGD